MKKILLLAFTLILACTSASAKKNDSQGNPEITFEEQSWDFGVINEKDGSVKHEFNFENTGNGNLVIIDATAQCGCTRPEFSKKPFAPGAKGKIKVTYNPAGRPGAFTKVVTVKTNGKPSKIRLKISGTVNPK